MKKFIAMMAGLVALMCACTKEETIDIVGEWEMVRIVTVEKENGKVVGEETTYPDTEGKQVLNFRADKTCFIYVVGGDDDAEVQSDGTWEIKGNTLYMYLHEFDGRDNNLELSIRAESEELVLIDSADEDYVVEIYFQRTTTEK